MTNFPDTFISHAFVHNYVCVKKASTSILTGSQFAHLDDVKNHRFAGDVVWVQKVNKSPQTS